MIQTRSSFLAVLMALTLLGVGSASAQISEGESPVDLTAETAEPDAVPSEEIEVSSTGSLASYVADFDAWETVASRAEVSVGSSVGTSFALSKLRSELVDWRERFANVQSVNAERIDTVARQLAALGQVPEDGEASTIADRRDALGTQMAELSAPRVLASEAYARADGLIGEIDAIIRNRQAAALTERGSSPLVPENWGPATVALTSGLVTLVSETSSIIAARSANGQVWNGLSAAALLISFGFILLIRGRIWIEGLWTRRSVVAGEWDALLHVLVTGAALVLPLMGLELLARGLDASNLFGFRGFQVIENLPLAGAYVLVGRWLSLQFFTKGRFEGPVHFSDNEQSRARRLVSSLGWVMALGSMVFVLIGSVDATGTVGSVLIFPVVLLLGWVLFGVGHLLYQHRTQKTGDSGTLLAFIGLIGRITMIAAVLGPILAAIGYSAAYRVFLVPTTKSLAVFGFLLIVNGLVFELYQSYRRRTLGEGAELEAEGLSAVFIAAILILLSLPFLALIWGASVDDLSELWTRFREGFSLGDTKISPTDLLTFVLVFALGYMITRVIQNMLRNTILPKTKLDIGGRNAIVSGIGYLGIFLAALFAITSAGIDLSSLAIVAGALSVGIGFGLQNIVSNFVAGIILLIERPISEGDLIEVGSQAGFVKSISVRSTCIETFDRTDVIVPNADLVSTQVTNWTRGNSVGRVVVPVGVAYGSDIEKVTSILKEIADNHPLVVFDPEPQVMMIGFGADSIDFEIRAIIRDVKYKLHTKSDMNHEIAKRFAEEGIEIPFAQRDIWIKNPEALFPSRPADQGANPA